MGCQDGGRAGEYGQSTRRRGRKQPVGLFAGAGGTARGHGAVGKSAGKGVKPGGVQRQGGQCAAACQQPAGQRPVGRRLPQKRCVACPKGKHLAPACRKAGVVQRVIQADNPLGRAGVFAVKGVGGGGVQKQRAGPAQRRAVQAGGVA